MSSTFEVTSESPQENKPRTLEEKRVLLKRLLAKKAKPVAHPLSYSQRSLWVQDQFQGPNATYNMKYGMWLNGPLNATVLERCFWAIARRHETLRTSFKLVDGEPHQMVHPPADQSLSVIDLHTLSQQEEHTQRLLVEYACHEFDLGQAPLLRLGLFRLSPQKHVLLLVMHHIISDGWSMSVFLKETIRLYESMTTQPGIELEPLPLQFNQYARAQQDQIASGALDSHITFWKDYLDGAPNLLELPTDKPRPFVQRFSGGKHVFTLDLNTLEQLRNVARLSKSTLFMTLGSALTALLSRYSGQMDLVIGTPVANRQKREHRDLIGYFINLLALRLDVSGNPSFLDMVRRFRGTARDVFAHQALPFDQVVQELNIPRSPNYQTLVQVVYALHSFEVEPLRLPGVTVDQRPIETGMAKFDLNVQCFERDNGLEIALEYNNDIFEHAGIVRLASHLTRLITSLLANPDMEMSKAQMLSSSEKSHILDLWRNDTQYPGHLPIHHMFEQQVSAQPEAIAVTDGHKKLTYDALNRRANQLAHRLIAQGVGGESLVVVSMERELDMIVGLLGILKAGAAYVPVDPNGPAERCRFILEDVAGTLLVTQSSLRDRFQTMDLPDLTHILVDEDGDWSEENPCQILDGDQCAYAIYTSGSTGKPKGVAVTHSQVHRLLSATQPWFQFESGDVWTCFHSFAFDFSIWEIWGALTTGSKLVLVDYARSRATQAFCDLMVAEGTTVLSQTPSAFYPLAEEILARNLSASDLPRVIVFGGEALSFPKLKAWFAHFGENGPKLINMYGITETCVHTTYHEVTADQLALGGSVIGQPIPDIQLYVLDGALNLVPQGVTGELFAGGAAPARGYFGRPSLTAQRFLPDPFSTQPGQRLYRSGDLTRWLANGPMAGRLEYKGRMDHQVKIRGFRIELGEIEAALLEQPEVESALVLVEEVETGPRLAAFLICGESRPEVHHLRTTLGVMLPEYMVPGIYVFLDRFPTTANDKVDHRALLAMIADSAEVARAAFVAPRNPEQEMLRCIWAETLKIDAGEFGIQDNFFSLGGHSLIATSLMSRVNEVFEVALSLRTIFESPTIEQLSLVIRSAQKGMDGKAPQPITAFTGSHPPLAMTQKRLWFFHQMEGANSAYNMPAALSIKGELNHEALERAITAVVHRHDILRTSFPSRNGQPYQLPGPKQDLHIPIIPLSHVAEAEREETVRAQVKELSRKPFDLEKGPIINLHLLQLSEKEHVLVCVMHHIVSDAWSLNIFIREMVEYYKGFCDGQALEPAPLPIQFSDFAAWQNSAQGEAETAASLDYWKQRLTGAPALLELPTWQPRPAIQTYRGAFSYFQIDASVVARLNSLAQQTDSTQFMLLMSAFSVLLSRWSGQADLCIGSLVSGRDRSETESLIGMFVTSLPLRFNLADNPTFRKHIQRTRREVLDGFSHQDVPFERIVDAVQPPRSLSHPPIFQVQVSHQNVAQDAFELPGLEMEWLKADSGAANYDIGFTLQEHADGHVGGSFRYNPDLFQEDMIQRMTGHFLKLVHGMLDHPDLPVLQVPMLTDEEVQNLSSERQPVPASYPGSDVISMLEQRVAASPNQTAVVHHDQTLSYAELNARANRFAHYLRKKGVGPDVQVAIYMNRDITMAVAILAVLKAGGCYVPLDPAYPEQRRRNMLEDAEATIVITNLPFEGADYDVLNPDLKQQEIQAEAETNLGLTIHPYNLLYVMYTSGSTGRPKGIALTHQCLTNLINWHLDTFSCDKGLLQFGSLSFDTSFHEMFAAWCAGDVLYLVPEENRLDALDLMTFVHEHRIGKINLPVAMTHLVGELYQTHKHLYEHLEDMISTGEQLHLTRNLVELFAERPDMRMHNHYGPAETHVITAYTYEGDPRRWPYYAPIGQPLVNTQVFPLDRFMGQVPAGALGELHLGGIMMARGYLNHPAHTAAKFVPDPYSGVAGGRLYKSGDLGRYLVNGHLEYASRIDHMVKIRGVRIELGEVASLLDKHPGVSRAHVMARGQHSSEKYLAAYVVPADGVTLTSTELRDYLSENLPPYMLPNAIVLLPTLPVTPNGKVDHRALPDPGKSEESYVAPRNDLEAEIAVIWAEILGKDKVGARDNFFELGGHSLLATQVVSRLRDSFEINLPIRALFEAATPETLAVRITQEQQQEGTGPELKPMPRGERPQLSFAQQRLWFLDRLEDLGPAYNMPNALRLTGHLDLAMLSDVLSEMVRRHESLRTNFPAVDGDPYQRIEPPFWLEPTLIQVPEDASEAWIMQRAHEEAATPFDLSEDRLFRVTLLRRNDEDHYLLFTLHHTVFDGWSFGVLVKEFVTLFQQHLEHGHLDSSLPELPVQYADFALWQRQFLVGDVLENQLSYWKTQLDGVPDVMNMPYDHPRPPVQSFKGQLHLFQIEEELLNRLESFSRDRDVTLFMTMMTVYKVLLARYTGGEDIVVGTPIANRNFSALEGVIGFFANTLVLRTSAEGNPSFANLLERVKANALQAYAHQDIPFEKLVEELRPERNMSIPPLFQVMFVLQNTPTAEAVLPGLKLSPVQLDLVTSKFDLNLMITDRDKGLRGRIEFNTDLFEADTIVRLWDHYHRLLSAVMAEPDCDIWTLPICGEAERQTLLHGWNNPSDPEATPRALHHTFEITAQRHENDVAAIFSGDEQPKQSMTYGELNRRANQLAAYLRQRGVGQGQAVGMFVPRSLEMAVAVLGILKTGACIAALDATYPAERLSYMITNADMQWILVTREHGEQLPEHQRNTLALDTQWAEIAACSSENLDIPCDPDDIFYIIYTSGSTGLPKGISLPHRAMTNLLEWHTQAIPGATRYLQFASICFDASYQEIFAPWMHGQAVCFIPEDLRMDPLALLKHVAAEEIDYVNLPVVVVHAWGEAYAENKDLFTHLTYLLSTGEQLTITPALKAMLTEREDLTLINNYGPSETHVVTSENFQTREWAYYAPIGKAIDHTQLYVVGPNMQLTPIGVPGRLYLAGDNVAQGYTKQPALTAEKFVPNPYSSTPGARMYDSGDQARYRADGTMVYLGRKDHQVKIRGYRIEPGEIESVLLDHPDLQECVVQPKERGDEKVLVAYVVPKEEQQVQVSQLRGYLQEYLPDYMVPAFFIALDALPLTSNRKIDRKALPEPDGLALGEEHKNPSTRVEMALAKIWEEVLRIEHVGLFDDFFALGGHSLSATKVHARAQKTLGVTLSLRDLFNYPVLADFAERVEYLRKDGQPLKHPLTRVSRDQPLPLSFGQSRLWFIDQLEPNSAAYVVTRPARIDGELDLDIFNRAFKLVVARHEVLRTVFREVDGEPTQVILDGKDQAVDIRDLTHLPKEERERRATAEIDEEATLPMDLSVGPLIRVIVWVMGEEDFLITFSINHTITDGWSRDVLIRDLCEYYLAIQEDREPSLPELTIQYADFSVWQRSQEETLKHQLAYWKNKLSDVEALEMPTDHPRPAVFRSVGTDYTFKISGEIDRALRKICSEHSITPYMMMLGAFKVMLHRYSTQNDIAIGASITNRSRDELEQLMGFFVNIQVIYTHMGGNPRFTDFLAHLRDDLLSAYDNRDLPFEHVVEALNPERDQSRHPLFQVMFSYEMAPDHKIHIPVRNYTVLDAEHTTTNFDLAMYQFEEEEGVHVLMEYSTDLFERSTIVRMGHNFNKLLESIVAQPDQRIDALAMLPDDEKQTLLYTWNETYAERLPAQTTHGLFRRQVEANPERVALSFPDREQTLTYGELGARVNRLAHQLRQHGVGRETFVCLCMERSVEMVVALMGIMESGGAYIPLDTSYPEERTRYIMEQSGAALLLMQASMRENKTAPTQVLYLDHEGIVEGIEYNEAEYQPTVVDPYNAAYMLYTSGSTGQPKGVVVPHEAVCNLIFWLEELLGPRPDERFLQKTPYTFDLSVVEFFWTLSQGAELVMARPGAHGDPKYLSEIMRSKEITCTYFVPSMLQNFLTHCQGETFRVNQIFSCGEALPVELQEQFFDVFEGELYNLYGPTEATVEVTWWRCRGKDEGTRLPIGSPIANTTVYILDQLGQPVSVGVAGELCLGGTNLARGYHGQAGQTAEKFTPHPFPQAGSEGERIYHTGDLCRFREDGALEYLRRIDTQVKLRGFRIELGEIESVLTEQENVVNAVVVLLQAGTDDARLVAYLEGPRSALDFEQIDTTTTVRASQASDAQVAVFKQQLRQRVPEYMVPDQFVLVEEIPLTSSGKANRKSLPDPKAWQRKEAYVAPRTTEEELLAGLWAEVLDKDAGTISTRSNFFHLGGHSLRATRLSALIRKTFAVELEIREIFAAPTIVEMAAMLPALRARTDVQHAPMPVERTEKMPLSFAQQRLWFLNSMEGASSTYNMPLAISLKGTLQINALEHALAHLVERHEVLRTWFPTIDGEVVQHISPYEGMHLPMHDLTHMAAADAEAKAQELASANAAHLFDLETGPLFIASLVRLREDNHMLLLNQHHVISDGWSLGVLVKEVLATYQNYSKDENVADLPALPLQYADYSVWQRNWLQGDVLQKQVDYWLNELGDAPDYIELPTKGPRPTHLTYNGSAVPLFVPPELTQQLHQLVKDSHTTLFLVLQTAYAALLSRYSGSFDVLVGTPLANRRHVELEPLIGFFVNTLVLRNRLNPQATVMDQLQSIREMSLGAFAHQDVPFERLVETLNPVRDTSRSPIFQVMFSFQNLHMSDVQLPGLDVSLNSQDYVTAKHELTLSMSEGNGGIEGYLEYNTDLFARSMVEAMAAHYVNLLGGMVDAAQRMEQLTILSPEEQQQVLHAWNDTDASLPQQQSVISLFDAQAHQNPDKVALIVDDARITYADLARKSGALAAHLATMGCGPESRVALVMERSPLLVAALLATLRTGAAYVPFDLNLPRERFRYMMADAAPSVVLTQTHLLNTLAEIEIPCICADEDHPSASFAGPDLHRDLAFNIIYTSGSTGLPKGTVITHGAVLNKVVDLANRFAVAHPYRHLVMSPLGFDPFAEQLLVPLTHGGTAVLVARPASLEPKQFWEMAQQLNIDTIDLVPSLLHHLLLDMEAHKPQKQFQRLLLGGEALPPSLWQKLSTLNLFAEVHNFYGPTEATIDAISYQIPTDHADAEIPLGQPMTNYSIFVLDPSLHPTPISAAGEIYIAGTGLARGYLDRPALTAERFLPHPFSEEHGARMYRSGDKAKWTPEGLLVFLGRMDQQVKVRGVRVEPGEIEASLSNLPEVNEAHVVVSDTEQGTRLDAVVTTTDANPHGETLRKALARTLPDSMVPSSIVIVEAMPTTANGKLDRKALMNLVASDQTQVFRAPETALEQTIASIFSELLDKTPISLDDNFFALGGHSLLGARLITRVRERLSLELPLRLLFQSPTVGSLAAEVAQLQSDARVLKPMVPVSRDLDLPLSFAQSRLWFIDQLEPGSTSYNMPIALRLKGTLNLDALNGSLQELVARHETLRTAFPATQGEPIQQIHAPQQIGLPIEDLSHLPNQEREIRARNLAIENAQTIFNLSTGPLWNAQLLRLQEDEHVFLMTMHHIISDGWSMAILTDELVEAYIRIDQGDTEPKSPLTIQYADYAHWQRDYLSEERIQAQLSWWQQNLDGLPQSLNLPTDRPRPAVMTTTGAHYAFSLDRDLSQALAELSQQRGATLFMTLSAAFSNLLSRYSGSQDLALGTPVANRNLVEQEALIGFFVNTLVLRVRHDNVASFHQILDQVRQTTLGAFDHQDIPFEKLVEELQVPRSLSHPPLFQVMFAMQNTPTVNLQLEGLEISTFEAEQNTSRNELSLFMNESPHGLQAGIEYNTDLFDTGTIARLAGHFGNLLKQVVAHPDQPMASLSLLSAEERQTLLHDHNQHFNPKGEMLRIAERVASFAASQGHKEAVADERTSLTYSELNERANALAYALIERGAVPDVPVGVHINRSVNFAVAVLAVWKAGATYLPLAPDLPHERLVYMIRDAQAQWVISEQDIPHCPVPVLQTWPEEPRPNPEVTVLGSHLAYIIYTSGTTGVPKGVGISYQALSSLHETQPDVLQVNEHSRVLQFSSIGFDVSIYEITMAWLVGGTLQMIDKATQLNPELLIPFMAERGITHVSAPQSLLCLVRDQGNLPALTTMMSAGEVMTREAVDNWAEGRRFLNLYGPTEATIIATAMDQCQNYEMPPIGTSLTNTRTYVLDNLGQPAPMGQPGQLFLGGSSLARGYLGKPARTAQSFVPDPFSGEPGARLYATGDLVRYLGDSNVLSFMGRIDSQVKIRGFRIELGEIEHRLGSADGVNMAAVAVQDHPNTGKRLVAYVTGCQDNDSERERLRKHMAAYLPEYMVPSTIQFLEEMPTNSSGKVARNLLPKPEEKQDTHRYEPPQNATEEALVQIWEEVLGVSGIGRKDLFFERGGHSLLAVKLVSLINQRMGIKLQLTDIFAAQSLDSMAALMQTGSTSSPLVPLNEPTSQPPIFAFHAAGGGVAIYRPLAQKLDRHVLGVQSPLLHDPHWQGDLAAYYRDVLLDQQKEGSFTLCGWSMGGLLAHRVAILLEEAGRHVEGLHLIDTHVIHGTAAIAEPLGQQIGTFALELGVGYEALIELKHLSHADLPTLLEKLHGLLEKFAIPLDASQVSQLWATRQQHLAWADAYLPERDFPCQLYAAADGEAQQSWQSVGLSPEVHLTKGDHYSMMVDPDLDAWIQILGSSTKSP